MRIRKTLIHNGIFITEDKFSIGINNRSFRYGDSVFETIYASKGNIHFFYEHLSRLVLGMKIMEMEVPGRFIADASGLISDIQTLLTRNRIYGGARIRMTAFRCEGGFYTPTTCVSEFIIEVSELQNTTYQLNKQGLLVDVYEKHHKQITTLGSFKSGNSAIFILAGLFAKKKNLNDCLILNQHGRVAETVSSNVFIVKDGVLITPPVSEGCVAGIIRYQILKLAQQNDIPNKEKALSVDEILNADELFFTNSITGVRWALAFQKHRYYNAFSKRFVELLNKQNQ